MTADLPPESPSPPPTTTVTITRPTIVVILYLLNFALGFSVMVGVVLAYVWRGEEETQEWERTHYTYLIRTFWIGLVVLMIAMFGYFGMFFGLIFAQHAAGGEPPSPMFFLLVFGMMGLFLLAAAWFAARCIRSLVRIGSRQPMPHPETWLF